MRKLTHQEIVQRQNQMRLNVCLPFCVVLNNVRSLYNVGSIFRTADGAGCEKLWLCGITGSPPNSQISKTALGAEDKIPWEHRADFVSVLKELKACGYQIVLLEQMEQSVSYVDFVPQSPVCLVIGHEVEGISEGISTFCDAAIEIEMQGIKNSLNVSVAFGIVAYQFRYSLTIQSDSSRDK